MNRGKGENMGLHTWGSWGLTVLLVMAASPVARGAVVLDQSFDPTGHITLNAGIAGSSSNQERAQTFKVGVTGFLTRVDVFSEVFFTPLFSLIMDLRGTVANGA